MLFNVSIFCIKLTLGQDFVMVVGAYSNDVLISVNGEDVAVICWNGKWNVFEYCPSGFGC